MAFDATALDLLNEIHSDVRELTQRAIPAINTDIATTKQDIIALQAAGDKLPCVERGSEIVALGHRTEILETNAEKRSANWAEIFKMLAAIGQTLVTAYLISKLI